MFVILAVVVLGSAILSVCTKSIMRAATFLLFVLFGIAGFIFCLTTPSLVLPRFLSMRVASR